MSEDGIVRDGLLPGDHVIVTGGGGGFGRSFSRRFAKMGAKVSVWDLNQESGDETVRLVRDAGGEATFFRVDLSSGPDIERAVNATLQVYGSPYGLVNNASIYPRGSILDMKVATFEKTLAVNITGQFLCARLAVPRLRKGKNASMINLSSAAGHLGFPGRSAYAASKWAVVGFTKSLALELGPEGIRVNAILPGAVDGPRIRAVIAAKAASLGKPVEDIARIYESQAAMGSMVSVEDIANMVLFATGDYARHVNGQELVVDGYTQVLS